MDADEMMQGFESPRDRWMIECARVYDQAIRDYVIALVPITGPTVDSFSVDERASSRTVLDSNGDIACVAYYLDEVWSPAPAQRGIPWVSSIDMKGHVQRATTRRVKAKSRRR